MTRRTKTPEQTVTEAARRAEIEIVSDGSKRRPVWVDPTPTQTLVAAGAGLIRSWHRIEESKTQVLRDLAIVVVKLRSHFRDNDGNIDWRGRSWDYRQTVAEMYDAAGIPPDSADSVQAALRYHVGNALRELVPRSQLEAVNLKPSSPKERFRQARNELNAAAEALSAADSPNERARVSRALSAAEHALKAAVAELDAIDERMAPTASESLERIVSLLDQLRDVISTRMGKDVSLFEE